MERKQKEQRAKDIEAIRQRWNRERGPACAEYPWIARWDDENGYDGHWCVWALNSSGGWFIAQTNEPFFDEVDAERMRGNGPVAQLLAGAPDDISTLLDEIDDLQNKLWWAKYEAGHQ